MTRFDDKIRAIRESLGLTRAEFADNLGVAERTVYSWEETGARPHPSTLRAIAERFDAWEALGLRSVRTAETPPKLSTEDLAERIACGVVRAQVPSVDQIRSVFHDELADVTARLDVIQRQLTRIEAAHEEVR